MSSPSPSKQAVQARTRLRYSEREQYARAFAGDPLSAAECVELLERLSRYRMALDRLKERKCGAGSEQAVERGAKALQKFLHGSAAEHWEQGYKEHREWWLALARACIQAASEEPGEEVPEFDQRTVDEIVKFAAKHDASGVLAHKIEAEFGDTGA